MIELLMFLAGSILPFFLSGCHKDNGGVYLEP